MEKCVEEFTRGQSPFAVKGIAECTGLLFAEVKKLRFGERIAGGSLKGALAGTR